MLNMHEDDRKRGKGKGDDEGNRVKGEDKEERG